MNFTDLMQWDALYWDVPEALWLVLLPAVMLLLPPYHQPGDAIRVPFFERLLSVSNAPRRPGVPPSPRALSHDLLLFLIWALLVFAAARPQWLGPAIEQQRAGRDLMVAVDLSGSMETDDFKNAEGLRVDRLRAVKTMLGQLADERVGDRLGLIVFGSAPFLQAPFTEDHATWRTLLNETRIRMAGPSTVLGDAIGLAIKLFEDAETEHRVLLVLTDGNDTGSIVPPIDAARVAASRGITIYPIAIGDPSTSGDEALDLTTLDRVAEITAGRRFSAIDRESLSEVLTVLNDIEPTLFASMVFRPKTDLHWLFVLLALVLFATASVVQRLLGKAGHEGDA
jgi:Ca-activated chloride channel family protein